MSYFLNLNPIIQTLIATFFTFFVTSLGSSIVFFFKKVNKAILNIMVSLSSGIMISASFFSLLNPAIDMSKNLNMITWLVLLIGFSLGSLFLFISCLITDKFLNKAKKKKSLKRSFMLILSITIHNIPEGMAIGVAFSSAAYNIGSASVYAALLLSLGIGIQNFPEGCAISLPLRQENLSRFKSFLFGSLSGAIEIISGLIGALLVLKITFLLPYLLSFAAGAMIYVVIEELIPTALEDEKKDLMTFLTLIGFSIMMILDIALS